MNIILWLIYPKRRSVNIIKQFPGLLLKIKQSYIVSEDFLAPYLIFQKCKKQLRMRIRALLLILLISSPDCKAVWVT